MRIKNCKILKIFSWAIVISFVYFFYISYESSLISNIPDNYLINENQSLPVFDPNTWIFNQHTAQYSTRLLLTSQKTLVAEALTFFNYNTESRVNILNKIKCIILHKSLVQTKIFVFSLTSAHMMPTAIYDSQNRMRNIWIVKCAFVLPTELKNDILIALTDFNEYNRVLLTNNLLHKSLLLSFHKPNFYNMSSAKKKAVVHCVHMVRFLNPTRSKRIRDWLTIQRKIGFDRVRLYFAEKDSRNEIEIKMLFGDFVEIVDYRLEFEFICRFALHIQTLGWVNNATSDYLFQNCRNFYQVYFKASKVHVSISHEKVCTNDCLLNFKYQYEFGTNYDFDELIFPRKLSTNSFEYFLAANRCENAHSKEKNSSIDLNSYNIYDYALKLKRKYGSDIAFFHFENVVFISNQYYWNLMKKLYNKPQSLQIVDSGKSLTLKINSKDFLRISQMEYLDKLVKCLNRTANKPATFDQIWNMPLAVLVDDRYGKSLYDLSLTNDFAQHDSGLLESGSRVFHVPIDDGFTSHFREKLLRIIKNQVYSFDHLRLDLEYYQFFAQLNQLT